MGGELAKADSPCPLRATRRFLAAVFVAAFLLRLAAVAALGPGLHSAPPPGSDEHEYAAYAWNVAQGRGYRGPSPDVADADRPTAYRPPVPSLYYAALYAVFGSRRYDVAHVANALLGGVTALLVFAITRRCFADGLAAARLAAVVYAAYPPGLYFHLTLSSEPIGALLVCLFAWCCLGVTDRRRGGAWALAAGAALGLLLLTKPGFATVMPLLPAWGALIGREFAGGARAVVWARVALIAGVAGLLLALWAARNARVFGTAIAFSTMGGSSLLQSNNRLVVGDPRLHGYSVWDTYLPEYAPALRSAGDEVTRDERARAFAVRWLRENPDKWFYLIRGKFVRLWSPRLEGEYGVRGLIVTAYYGAILAAFLATLVPVTLRLLRERHPGLILPYVLAANTLTALVIFGMPRYRFPVDALVVCMAAGGLVAAIRTARRGGALRAAVLSARARPDGRHTARAAAGMVAAALALAAWVRADDLHIERYRDGECRRRLEAIRGAYAAFESARGRPPAGWDDLVPDYLPNVDALHCPKHSLAFHEYALLESRDARGAAAALVSYSLPAAPDAARGGTRREVVETAARHPGGANRVALSGGSVARAPGARHIRTAAAEGDPQPARHRP